MTQLIYTELDFVCAIILFIILDKTRLAYLSEEQKCFKCSIILLIFVLISDGLSWVADGGTFYGSRALNIASNYVHWFLAMTPSFFSMMYCLRVIEAPRRRELELAALIPTAVAFILIATNPFTKFVFTFTENNIYTREPYFFIVSMIPFVHVFIAFVEVVIKLVKSPGYEHKKYAVYIIYIIMPFIGTMIQILFYGFSTLWPSYTIAIVICYVYIQHGNVTTDELSGLNNRRRFDVYLKYAYDAVTEKDNNLYLVILDINKFKQINDTYGHSEGDKVIEIVSAGLREIASDENLFVARIGGDEFSLVVNNTSSEYVDNLIKEIRTIVAEKCSRRKLQYEVTIAIGYARVDGTNKKSTTKLFNEADKNMYDNKQKMGGSIH